MTALQFIENWETHHRDIPVETLEFRIRKIISADKNISRTIAFNYEQLEIAEKRFPEFLHVEFMFYILYPLNFTCTIIV